MHWLQWEMIYPPGLTICMHFLPKICTFDHFLAIFLPFTLHKTAPYLSITPKIRAFQTLCAHVVLGWGWTEDSRQGHEPRVAVVTVTALWSTDRHYQLMLCRVSQSQWWSHSTRALDFPFLMAPAHERDPYLPVEQTGRSDPKSCPKIPPRLRHRSRGSAIPGAGWAHGTFPPWLCSHNSPSGWPQPSKQSHSLNGDKRHWTWKNAAWSVWGEVILNKGARWWEEMWPEAKAEKGTRER